MGKGMKEVKVADIQVVPEEFVAKVKAGGTVIDLIKSLNLAAWGGEVGPGWLLVTYRVTPLKN